MGKDILSSDAFFELKQNTVFLQIANKFSSNPDKDKKEPHCLAEAKTNIGNFDSSNETYVPNFASDKAKPKHTLIILKTKFNYHFH